MKGQKYFELDPWHDIWEGCVGGRGLHACFSIKSSPECFLQIFVLSVIQLEIFDDIFSVFALPHDYERSSIVLGIIQWSAVTVPTVLQVDYRLTYLWFDPRWLFVDFLLLANGSDSGHPIHNHILTDFDFGNWKVKIKDRNQSYEQLIKLNLCFGFDTVNEFCFWTVTK